MSFESQVNVVTFDGRTPHRVAAVREFQERRALEAIGNARAVALGRSSFDVELAEGWVSLETERRVSLDALMATKEAFHQWTATVPSRVSSLARFLWRDVATDPRPCAHAAQRLHDAGPDALEVALRLLEDGWDLGVEELVETAVSVSSRPQGAAPAALRPVQLD